MEEKYIYYDFNGKRYKIAESDSAEFEKDIPNARINISVKGKNYNIGIKDKSEFLNDFSGYDWSYTDFKDNTQFEEPDKSTEPSAQENKDDKTNIFETIGKGLGAAGTGTAKLALDLGQAAWQISPFGWFDGKKLDEVLQDESNPVSRASMKLGELQERLSREADPTGGQQGFVDLIKEGKIGMAAQKALGSGLESLPMMLAAGTGVGSVVYGAALAAGNYANETRENDDIPAWKRGVNSVGSAALEMAVEKIGGPLKNLGGKAGKEITEEMAKEAIERFAKDGTEMVSKRIFNVLKEGAEEGVEEIATSFGNDALGTALDLIDGDKDYGIHAQWEQMKEQNPDADLGDFAKTKAKEYLDSFLGGALSGMEISGTTDAIRLGVSSGRNNQIDDARNLGSRMGLQGMYDVNDQLAKSSIEVEKAFVGKDGNPMLSRDFISSLTADEAYQLSQEEDMTHAQKKALFWHARRKAVQEGLNEKLDAELNNRISTQNKYIDETESNGVVVTGIYNNQPVYVKGGVSNSGVVTLPDGSNGPVVIINGLTGESTTVRTEDIKMPESINTDEYRTRIETQLRTNDAHNREVWSAKVSDDAKQKDVEQYANTKILINVGDKLVKVDVEKILPDGKVLIKGKKGDLNGQSELEIPATQLYDSIARNEDGSPVFVEALPQKEQETAEVVEEPVAEEVPATEVTGEEDYRGEDVTILINGNPVNVEVISQDNTSDTISYEYEDKNGNRRIGSSTIGAFKSSIQPEAVEAPVEETPIEEPATEEPVAEEKTELEAEDINWDALLEQDSELFFSEMQNQFGEEAIDYISAIAESTQEEINSLGKMKGKSTNQIIADKKRQKELQNKLSILNEMAERLTSEPVVDEVVTETEQEPTLEAVENEQEATTPEAVEDVTAEIEIPERVVIPMDNTTEPMNGVEFAAQELGLKNGGIKLLYDSYKKHTGFGNEDSKQLFDLFRTKEKGGMTLEEAGERLMELDRENNTGFFDQNDPNAGLDAILDVLGSNKTLKDLRTYVARQRQAEAQREADAMYAEEMAAYENEMHYNEVRGKELKSKYVLSDEENNELNTIFAEVNNNYESGNQGETASVYEAEEIGDLPDAEGEISGEDKRSDSLLQGSQSVQTRGEGDLEERGTGDNLSRQDAGTPVYDGESQVYEGSTTAEESISSLDEDLPDFTTEVTPTPVAPKPVANPIAEAQKREKSLLKQLPRTEIPHEERQDLAYNAGKAVADMFATREEYEAYEEIAADLGEFIDDFDRGVKESFNNRISRATKTDKNLSNEYRDKENSGNFVEQSELNRDNEVARAINDSRGVPSNEGGIYREEPSSKPYGKGQKLVYVHNVPAGITWEGYANFNPISTRIGESETDRQAREYKFNSNISSLTSDERFELYDILSKYLPLSSSELKYRTDKAIASLRDSGNDMLANIIADTVIDELTYRDTIAKSISLKYGLDINAPYSISWISHIFDAKNTAAKKANENYTDEYNTVLFDRVLELAKRFGVTISFTTKDNNNRFLDFAGWYTPAHNTIAIDVTLLEKGREKQFCHTLLHELIHSVVSRSALIMSGRAIDMDGNIIDPSSLPKDVIDGINSLKKVHAKIKHDQDFKDQYGKVDFEEMLSEISNPEFRKLLKVKKVWKEFIRGVSRILGISTKTYTESDALTEIELALDKILSSGERGELDAVYSEYYGESSTINPLGYSDVATPTEVSRETAAQVYDREVKREWQEFQRQFQDAFQPVRIAIEAIQQETGNVPVEDYENYPLIQNQSSSRSRAQIDKFRDRYYSPIVKQINSIIDKIMEYRGLNISDEAKRSEVYEEVIQYLIAKHGIERNEYYQTHKTRKLYEYEKDTLRNEAKKDYDTEVNMINTNNNLTEAERQLKLREALDAYNATLTEIETREVPDMRDYSGLTALFNLDSKDFKKAEEMAQEMVDKFESLVDTEKLWNKINKATDKTLRHSYESGLLSRQQYNDIKSMFKFYIPLRGFDETTAEDVYSYARFEGNRFNPAVKTAKGRTSLADDPIAIIMNMAESEIAQGNKNRAKQSIYYFLLNRIGANNKQNSLMQIEDVWYTINIDENGKEVRQVAVPNHEQGETYEAFENKMQALAEEGKAAKSEKGKLDVGMRFQKQSNRNAHYVYLKINGVEKAIFVNGDPKAADAINGKNTSTLGEGAKKFRDFQRFISSMFTNYSLEFTARNYFRDMIYSHINIDIVEPDPEYRKKFRQNWRSNNMRTMLKLLKAYRAGEFENRPLTETEAAFVEFMENGGQTGYTLINSVENHKKELEKAIERMRNGVEKGGIKDSAIFKATLGGVELLNEASELVTRFAAYKTSRDMGRGVVKSISDAKEITVNFNTKGAQDASAKNWMGAVASYFGWSKFFFNASVQGVQRIKAMADANKLKFCGTVGGMIAAGFFMPIITSAIAELLGGDDEEEYWNIPEYDRQNNFCIPLGNGKYVKIPLPIGFREVYAIGDMVAAMLMDKRFRRDFGQIGMDMANKVASVVLPINPLESQANGLSIWHTALYTALPSSLQFAVQNATNIDWKGAPLQKEYTYNENDPQWMKAFASNPDWLTGLSKWCNEHINLDGDYEGMDWSPEKVDNILSNMFGGIYSLIKKSGKTISMIWNEDNRNLSNVPLSGVVLGSGIESDDRFVTDAYYDMQDYYDANVNYIKRRAENFGYKLDDVFLKEKGKHHPKMMEIYQNSNFDFMQEWYKGSKELKELQKEVKDIEKKIAEKGYPSEVLTNKLLKAKTKLENERREFVDDMLELD